MCFRALLYAVFHSIRRDFGGSTRKIVAQKVSDGRVRQNGFQFLRWLYSQPLRCLAGGPGWAGWLAGWLAWLRSCYWLRRSRIHSRKSLITTQDIRKYYSRYTSIGGRPRPFGLGLLRSAPAADIVAWSSPGYFPSCGEGQNRFLSCFFNGFLDR